MTRDEAQQRLHNLANAVNAAVLLIKTEQDTLDHYFAEKQRMDDIGPILDPTLFNSGERRATEAMMTPIFEAARTFIRHYDLHVEHAKATLLKVQAGR